MTEEKLKEYFIQYPFLGKYVTIKNFYPYDSFCGIRMCRKSFRREYLVGEWVEISLGHYGFKSDKTFKKKEEAINYLWELFGGDEKLKELITVYNKN